tara:strand:+ start:1657 stop:3228 length:1572 start_codon:yes stop_codon:yes gene_type:complete
MNVIVRGKNVRQSPNGLPCGGFSWGYLPLLVTIQFPIADARPFGPEPNLRLTLPDWPEPNSSLNPQYVHYFGKAAERIGEPDEAWPDEIKFIQAARGIRFDKLETRHSGFAGRRFHPKCAFRRLFCDGRAVVRIEIGIVHNRTANPLKNLTLEEALCMVNGIAEIPTLVSSVTDEPKLRPILTQGKYLARLYANASMNRIVPECASGLKLVEAGAPVILVELTPEEMPENANILIPDGFTVLKKTSVNGANALFCRLNSSVGIVSTWIIQKGTATEQQLRSLRLCLIRLHAEREVLDIILKQIHRGKLLNPLSEYAVDMLDQYFNERLKIVNRNKWGGMNQSEIVAAFDATQAIVRPAIQEQLTRRYEGGRLQVWKKIEAYQEKRQATRLVREFNIYKGGNVIEKQFNVTNFGGNVNVADYMSNVTNTVNNNLSESVVDNEIKVLIKQLNQEIERVASKVDPGQVKKMGKNLEALSKELVSEEPERRWYEVSIEGIMDAAKAVGAIADPVFSIAEKLLKLLII